MKKADNYQISNAEMVTISRAEYEEFQAQRKKISELESRVDLLMEALRLARHKQFGASSEKSEDTLVEQLSFLFNEAEVFFAAEKEEEAVTIVAAHKRHKKHEYTLDNIPEGIETKQVEHRLEGEDLICTQCGDTMTEIGKEVVRTLEIIPAQTIVHEDIYYTYACKNCSESADEGCETPIAKAPREKNIIPGSFATPEAIAHIMTQKFVMGSPLYRQEQEMNRKGIHLSRQTMSNWILKATEDYLTPVYEQLHKELLSRDVLHADETTLQVLHEPGKKPQTDSYMWLYRTGGDTNKLLFCMNTSRAGEQSIRKNSLPDIRVTSIRMVMPDTMTWEKILLSLDAGPMPGESSTRQRSPCLRARRKAVLHPRD